MSSSFSLWCALCTIWLADVVESQATAHFRGTCVDFMTLQRADDGVNYVNITSSLSGNPDKWSELKSGVLSGITSSTKLRITCVDGGGSGGLIATIKYRNIHYSTNGAQQNYGLFTLEGASSGLTITASPPEGIQDNWGAVWPLYDVPYHARWTWACGVGNNYTACPAPHTEVYVFDFGSIPPRTAHFQGTCDDQMRLERADDGVHYVNITDSLSGDLGNWAQIKSAVFGQVRSTTKLRITCVDVDGGAGGLIATIQYGGAHFSTNGAQQNNGYFALESSTSGRNSTVTPFDSWGDVASIAGLYAEPYNANWTWTCGVGGGFKACPATHTEVYVFDFGSIPKYVYVNTSINWTSADNYCAETYGTHLASWSTDAEAAQIQAVTPTHSWMGLSDRGTANVWEFSDGRVDCMRLAGGAGCALNFDYWWPGEPNDDVGTNNDCGRTVPGESIRDMLGAAPCNWAQTFVCNAFETDPTTDPTVRTPNTRRMAAAAYYEELVLTVNADGSVPFDTGSTYFNNRFWSSGVHILKRVCSSCTSSHRLIYYKRLTSLTSFDMYYNTKTVWTAVDNRRAIEFNLYSSLNDLENNVNAWSWCNANDYDNLVGFPRDCGPSGSVGCQFVSTLSSRWSGTGCTKTASFYILRDPTSNPTSDPTSDPTNDPTGDPTIDPTIDPTTDPTADPTADPTIDPTPDPTGEPTTEPTVEPTSEPTLEPTAAPTAEPTLEPTTEPTADPTTDPTTDPPTASPTTSPTFAPTSAPTFVPSAAPTTAAPTVIPTEHPSNVPSQPPTVLPSAQPSLLPTPIPSLPPTTAIPTLSPTSRIYCEMTVNASLDVVERDAASRGITMVMILTEVLRACIDVRRNPQLESVEIGIRGWRRGSIIISYELVYSDPTYIEFALSNINETVASNTGIVIADSNITFPITGNEVFTLAPTLQPTTYDPTEGPTTGPTSDPTVVPTLNPTAEPTTGPTSSPTPAPTHGDIHCNDGGHLRDGDGFWEYYLHIEREQMVRFDTCGASIDGANDQIFDIHLFGNAYNVTGEDEDIGCTACGITCIQTSQHVVLLAAGTYLMQIHGPHLFHVVCTDTLLPTYIPTNLPTKAPIATTNTRTPTEMPFSTTPFPTEADPPRFNATFAADSPWTLQPLLSDPFGRFESFATLVVLDEQRVFGLIEQCKSCFVWHFRRTDNASGDASSPWVKLNTTTSGRVSVSIKKENQQYLVTLTITSARTANSGNCIHENDEMIFAEGQTYELRVSFVILKGQYVMDSVSDHLSIATNTLPSDGICIVQNMVNLQPLDQYNLECANWRDQDELEFNALINNVKMSREYVSDARSIAGYAPLGEVSIVVLVKQKQFPTAISCHPITTEFKSIADVLQPTDNDTEVDTVAVVNDFIGQIMHLSNTTAYAQEPDVAVSVVSVVEEFYANNLTTKEDAAIIIDAVVQNIVGGSVLDIVIEVGADATNNITWSVYGDGIVTELATIAEITSNEGIVSAETTTKQLVDTYLPEVFEAIDVFVVGSVAQSGANGSTISAADQYILQQQLNTIATQSQDLIRNLELTLQATLEAVTKNIQAVSEELISLLNDLAVNLIDFATKAASKALAASNIGESYNYESTQYNADGSVKSQKRLSSTKFKSDLNFNDSSSEIVFDEIELPSCGVSDTQRITVPLSFMQQQQDRTFDCTFMSSTQSNFISKNTTQRENRTQESEVVTATMYDAISSVSILLQVDNCFPYLLTMELSPAAAASYSLDFDFNSSSDWPQCDFWNVQDSQWSNIGCFVYNITNTTVTCACTHLTSFSVSQEDILPDANILTEIDWRRLTWANVMRYPAVLLTSLACLGLFAVILCINPRSDIKTGSIMAFEDIIYKSVQDEKLWLDIAGKEIKYITDHMPNQHLLGGGITNVANDKQSTKSLCVLQLKLFKAYLRNDHTLLSIFQRTAGTNFSVRQRMGCFWMYLTTIMVVTGTFYGVDQETRYHDVAASFIISLCGTLPVLVTRKLFEKSKPTEIKSIKHDLREIERTVQQAHMDDSKQAEERDGDAANEETNVAFDDFFGVQGLKEFVTTHRGTVTLQAFQQYVSRMFEANDESKKILTVSNIRRLIFDDLFPLPNKCKKVAWIALIVWSIAACVTAMVYGLQFDALYDSRLNPENVNYEEYATDPCWDNNLYLHLEAEKSDAQFAALNVQQNIENESSYGGGDAQSWLLSVFQSLLTSLVLWQPLMVYIVTWIKIWLFTHHLKMKIGPVNLLLLCKRCCCGQDADEHIDGDAINNMGLKSKLSRLMSRGKQAPKHQLRNSAKITAVIANKSRPVDVISFLGNGSWVIDDTVNHSQPEKKEELVPTRNDIELVVASQTRQPVHLAGVTMSVDETLNQMPTEEEIVQAIDDDQVRTAGEVPVGNDVTPSDNDAKVEEENEHQQDEEHGNVGGNEFVEDVLYNYMQ